MSQFGFYYNTENCIGCHSCQVACKDTHRLEVGENYRTVSTFCTGSGYAPHLYHISMACNHCALPTCMSACQVGALLRNDEGLIIVDDQVCNGCGDCMSACPYGAITMLREGVAGKCNGCIELRALGEDPACVASCPQRVLEFGEISALRAAHSQQDLVCDATALPDSSTIKPNLVMRIKNCMTDPDFDRLII